ncbi:AAA family ATPase [Bacteroides difficilis]|uniref:ATP-binding protein n=1 Tax=Bacteroides difficilis TaxID=2763021 RepID=A0ABR7CEN8_9BACE|nr:ATP-binding protein [Bacteroides difficilis]MBC5605999.1 ATP-binding protein [Bacteroides difficilis]
MIINFTVGNYRSFRDKKVLSMEATAIKELNESIIERDGYKLLPSAVIYGANSSGKSNLLKAIRKFREMISTSSKLNSTDKLNITPFLLNPHTVQEPSSFEIELLINKQIYTYGFTADNQKVYEEWLYVKKGKNKKEICLFGRIEEGIGIGDEYSEGVGLEEKVRDNGLFLSTVDSFNGEIAGNIISAINSIAIISGINHESLSTFTNKLCTQATFSLEFQQKVQGFLNSMNVGFTKFEIPKDEKLAEEIKAYTIHHLYNDEGEIIGETRFSMKEHESSGTNKLFDLAALVIGQLDFGYPLIVDELDSKLHPLLTQHIIKLFNNPKTNPKGAQLIFATHDTNLLNVKTFRRDQIWFTEKDHSEATDLYSLAEFREPEGNKIRKDRSFEKDYINGRYGAIPYIKD